MFHLLESRVKVNYFKLFCMGDLPIFPIYFIESFISINMDSWIFLYFGLQSNSTLIILSLK